MAALTQARIREYFNYDPLTGDLIVRERPRSEFAPNWHSRHLKRVGKPAGKLNVEGYLKVTIDGRLYSAHRVIWMLVHGEMPAYPDFEIDHVNGNRSDNRIGNLRKVTKSLNQRNGAMRRNNTSGRRRRRRH